MGLNILTTDDGSRTLYDSDAGESFHSESGAVSEARHVYVANSAVGRRLSRGGRVDVLEVGLGAGLNFLVTADEALRHSGELQYVALERDLVPVSLVKRLDYGQWLDHPPLAAALAARWPGGSNDPRRPIRLGDRITLSVVTGEARRTAAELTGAFHVVYHDGFSPRANPELWNQPFLEQLFSLLRPGGRLVSYCVSTSVRKRLQSAGFAARACPGPAGGKREVLIADKPDG